MGYKWFVFDVGSGNMRTTLMVDDHLLAEQGRLLISTRDRRAGEPHILRCVAAIDPIAAECDETTGKSGVSHHP
jgi:hypothetical protein